MTRSLSRNSGFSLADARVYPARGEIHVAGDVHRVEPLVMDVLFLLAENAGEVVSRDTLIEVVWKGAIVSDDVISRCVYRLRKVLGDTGRQIIRTVPKRGYLLTVSAAAIEPEGTSADGDNGGTGSERAARSFPLPAAAMLAAVLFAAALFAFWPAAERGDPVNYTVAITPCDAGSDVNVVGAGLAEDLLYRLSRNPNLRVLARATSFRDSDALARSLDDENLVILEGSIVDEGERWIVDVRLLDAADGTKLWQQRLESDDLTVTGVQSSIEVGILQALNAMPDGLLSPDDGFASDDLEAYRAVLQGREWILSRDPELLSRATNLFGLAAGLDPNYSAAYVSMAEGRVHQAIYGGIAWDRVSETANDAIERALELAPDSAHAHAVKGLVQHLDNKLELAEPSLRKALELNPGYAEAHMWLGRVYLELGRTEEAADAFASTVTLSPLASTGYMNLGMAQTTMGRFDAAVANYQQALDIDPENHNVLWAIAYAQWQRGDLEPALEAFADASERGVVNADFFAQYALAAFDAGRSDLGSINTRKAVQIAPNYLWSIRALWADFLVPGRDLDGLAAELEARATDADHRNTMQMNLALAHAAAGKWQEASTLYETSFLSQDSLFLFHWDATWGVSHMLALAGVRRALGEPHADLLDRVESFVANLEAQPMEAAGLAYLRASIAALRGDAEASLTLLQEAHAYGWRRWWWTEVDPSWATLRGTSAFETTVAELRASPAPEPRVASRQSPQP